MQHGKQNIRVFIYRQKLYQKSFICQVESITMGHDTNTIYKTNSETAFLTGIHITMHFSFDLASGLEDDVVFEFLLGPCKIPILTSRITIWVSQAK